MDNLKVIGGAAFVVGLFSFVIWLHVTNWNECRTIHSWLYCYHTLGK